MAKPKTEYYITSAVGRVGPFSTRASAEAYKRRIRASGSVPAGLKVEKKRINPGTTIRGWVRAKAVKIVRNKRGQAVSVKIRT